MNLSNIEKERILELAAYELPPENEFEKNFVQAVEDRSPPQSVKAKEWLEFYRRWAADERAVRLGYCINTPEAKAEYRERHSWEKEEE